MNLQKPYRILLNFILPPSREVLALREFAATELKDLMTPKTFCDGENITTLFNYNDENIRKLIWAFKYKKDEAITQEFAHILYEYLFEEFSDIQQFSSSKKILLVPVPLSKKRTRERGYNQSELLAKELIAIDNADLFSLENNVVLKIKETKNQTDISSKKVRKENIRGAFIVSNPSKIKNNIILILDDMVTTGSTLSELKSTMCQAKPEEIYAVALGHKY